MAKLLVLPWVISVTCPIAKSRKELREMITTSDAAPPVGVDTVEMLCTIAEERARDRGESSPLEETARECVIGADWDGFAKNEFGYSGGKINRWAFGVYEVDVSAGRDATLFTDVAVVRAADGDTTCYLDDDYDDAVHGEMWVPDGALEHLFVAELDPKCVHGQTSLADAM